MPLQPIPARKLLRDLLKSGKFISPGAGTHARQEMNKDGITDPDILNVLRGGTVDPPEWENGDWRYRVRTQRFTVIVALDPEPDENEPPDVEETEIHIVTAWRNGP